MQAYFLGDNVRVQLSRRNLTQLIEMLDRKVGNSTLKRLTETGVPLYVTAEEDDEHYGDRKPGPGLDEIRHLLPPMLVEKAVNQ